MKANSESVKEINDRLKTKGEMKNDSIAIQYVLKTKSPGNSIPHYEYVNTHTNVSIHTDDLYIRLLITIVHLSTLM